MKSLKASERSTLLTALEKEQTKRLLQSNLIEYTKYFFDAVGDEFVVNPHHEKIAEALRLVEEGKIKNLLINIPPRYGKTCLAVINWISQCIGKNPKAKFIHLSYSDDLALENSSSTKTIIESDEFQEFWPVKLRADSKSKKKWYTEEGGGVYATAAGGAITGFGAGATQQPDDQFYGAIVIDDPLKVDDAESEGERGRVNKRLNTTIKSRRNSRKTPIIVIMQRLHEDDMSGFILESGMGEEFYHLKLPAIQADGTALWPFKHTLEELAVENKADPRTFSGQMMQEPSPDDGVFFQRAWFQRYDIGDEPEQLAVYGASDYAVTEGGGDFTEQGVAGFDEHEDLWFLNWWSGQTTPDKWIAEQFILVERYTPFVWVAEGGIIRRAVEPFLKKEQRTKSMYYMLEWITSGKNKAANARAFQALASQGKVHIPNTPWGEALITQLLKFPDGKYDDKVDVCGLFGRILDQTYAPRVVGLVAIPRETDMWGRVTHDTSGWKVN